MCRPSSPVHPDAMVSALKNQVIERQFENMDVQSAAMEQSLGSTTAMSTPQADVDSLLSEVADEHGLELGSMLPEAGRVAVSAPPEEETAAKESDDDLARRLNELMAGR